jgi:serine/threonine protein kinase
VIGELIGHYEIREKLGEGGMGVVYKGRDTSLNRFVALKLLPVDKLGDQEQVRRLTQEARTASALNHPNIITIHEIGCEQGTHFIVMEYVRGKSLDRLIPRKGMAIGEVLKISVQIAEALAVAAGADVIHRDVKPGNVMVSDTGHVKVLDFGLAKLSERTLSSEGATVTIATADEERPKTTEGEVLGTVSYMSPEQAQGKPLDQRSDIFSFGALLYEMTTGQRAFHGENSVSTISSILRDDPKPAMEISPEVPRELDRIIVRCLRKDPERRFQHMADVRVALLEFERGIRVREASSAVGHVEEDGIIVLVDPGWVCSARSWRSTRFRSSPEYYITFRVGATHGSVYGLCRPAGRASVFPGRQPDRLPLDRG